VSLEPSAYLQLFVQLFLQLFLQLFPSDGVRHGIQQYYRHRHAASMLYSEVTP